MKLVKIRLSAAFNYKSKAAFDILSDMCERLDKFDNEVHMVINGRFYILPLSACEWIEADPKEYVNERFLETDKAIQETMIAIEKRQLTIADKLKVGRPKKV